MSTKETIIAAFNTKRELNIKFIAALNEDYTSDSAAWLKMVMEFMVSDLGVSIFTKNRGDIDDLMMDASEAVAKQINVSKYAAIDASDRAASDMEYRTRNIRNQSIKTYSNY